MGVVFSLKSRLFLRHSLSYRFSLVQVNNLHWSIGETKTGLTVKQQIRNHSAAHEKRSAIGCQCLLWRKEREDKKGGQAGTDHLSLSQCQKKFVQQSQMRDTAPNLCDAGIELKILCCPAKRGTSAYPSFRRWISSHWLWPDVAECVPHDWGLLSVTKVMTGVFKRNGTVHNACNTRDFFLRTPPLIGTILRVPLISVQLRTFEGGWQGKSTVHYSRCPLWHHLHKWFHLPPRKACIKHAATHFRGINKKGGAAKQLISV